MPVDKNLEVYEDYRSMGITLKWFTPIAFFLLFFSFAWNGFLVFWYSMAFLGEAPWIMVLFPVLHVAVGLYLIYYTLCLFFNKTYIDIAGDYLTVKHSPIPWWRGNRRVPTNAIEQLYVSEKKSEGKNGAQFSYQLRARLYDKTDLDILALDELSAGELQQIEEHLERFMGINDDPVKGEYGKKEDAVREERPRRPGRPFSDPILGSIYLSKEREVFDLKGEEMEIVSVTQYDWNDGNSDRAFQLLNGLKQERRVFLEQNQALLHLYQERELNIFETNLTRFQLDTPPISIVVGGREYFPTHFKTGKYFTTGVSKGLEVKQWHYATKDQHSFLRVVNFQNTVTFFLGEKLQKSDFDDTLDLDQQPPRDLETRERGWNEEDLV